MADTNQDTGKIYDSNNNDITDTFVGILAQELMDLEGIHLQNPETGANVRGKDNINTWLNKYTNRIFGAPFQLLDSADKRFDKVNKYLGNEYLRHFILNSPILHIKPGMPKYTGGADGNSLVKSIKEVYLGTTSGNMSFVESLLTELAKGTIFGAGSRLQKRMFGFRETYYQYNQHVNYMCRSMATFLGLTDTNFYAFDGTNFDPKVNESGAKLYPNGAFQSYKKFVTFDKFKWENYRMIDGNTVLQPYDMLVKLKNATLIGATIDSALESFNLGLSTIGHSIEALGTEGLQIYANAVNDQSLTDAAVSKLTGIGEQVANESSESNEKISNSYSEAWNTSLTDVMVDKISSVQFMVEPQQFEESLQNQTQDSQIASAIDSATSGIGSELAFITGSKVDAGMIGTLTEFLGNTVQTAAEFVGGIVEPIAGGFASNLLTGALGSIKGQRMIYPKIYSQSSSDMQYTFSVNLSTPYGDVYNYYMNIIVPLCHLICLAAPRMVTSNSVQSPYLVQAYMPGMVTCQLGIINSMTITKNPAINRVSVNGFPLDVKITFTIEELYHNLSISPANDPASFMFNETLNDYMANLAGLIPSVDTYTQQRKVTFNAMASYFSDGDWGQDIANQVLTKIEDTVNPFIANGS